MEDWQKEARDKVLKEFNNDPIKLAQKILDLQGEIFDLYEQQDMQE